MKVKFLPMDVELEIKPYQSVMDLAHKNGIKIKSVCNGMPSCAECRIKLTEGDANVLPPSAKELSLIGTGHFIDQRRLSCQLVCFGDVVVDLTEQIEKADSDTHRKPQGNNRSEHAEVSRAVTGNLIEQDDDIKQFMGQFKDSDLNDSNESKSKSDAPQRRDNQNQQRSDQNRGDQPRRDQRNDRNNGQGRNNEQGRSRDQGRNDRSKHHGHGRRDQQTTQGNQQPAKPNDRNADRGNERNGDRNLNAEAQKSQGNPRKPFKFRPQ